MTRPELDKMLEQAVAEAIGVPYRSKPVKRAYKPRSAVSYRPAYRPVAARELQHA
jgi:hypothetical protein